MKITLLVNLIIINLSNFFSRLFVLEPICSFCSQFSPHWRFPWLKVIYRSLCDFYGWNHVCHLFGMTILKLRRYSWIFLVVVRAFLEAIFFFFSSGLNVKSNPSFFQSPHWVISPFSKRVISRKRCVCLNLHHGEKMQTVWFEMFSFFSTIRKKKVSAKKFSAKITKLAKFYIQIFWRHL